MYGSWLLSRCWLLGLNRVVEEVGLGSLWLLLSFDKLALMWEAPFILLLLKDLLVLDRFGMIDLLKDCIFIHDSYPVFVLRVYQLR